MGPTGQGPSYLNTLAGDFLAIDKNTSDASWFLKTYRRVEMAKTSKKTI
jgi:hypothetical protein